MKEYVHQPFLLENSNWIGPVILTLRWAVYGTLSHPATRPSKTYSMAVRAIPLSVCHQGPPNGYRTGFKRCSDAQKFKLTVVDDINAKAVEAWKQKRSIDYDMYTLILLIQYSIYFWHELAYTLLYFLKLKLNICGNPLAFLWLFDLQYYLNCT